MLDTQSLVARFGLVTATFIVAVVSALFPPVNIELFLLAVAAVAKPASLPAVLVAASVGQMAGKIAFYFAGRGLMSLRLGRRRRRQRHERDEEKPVSHRATQDRAHPRERQT